MVGNLFGGNNRDNDQSNRGDQNNEANNRRVRIPYNHNESEETIRRLIQGALTPLPANPVPDTVIIRNIEIFREPEGTLTINCQVRFESSQRR